MAERLDLDAIRHRWAPDLWDRNAAVAAAMQARQDVHALIEEVVRLREALGWYASVDDEYAARAREALEGPAG